MDVTSIIEQLDADRWQEMMDVMVATVTTYGFSVIGAVVTLLIGWLASRWVSASLRKLLKKAKTDATLSHFFCSMVRYGILAFTGVAVLAKFGVQTASLVAVLGAAGLAIGLALQGTLSHVASGVMLLMFRPFKIGDFIEAGGHAGTVKEVNLFTTQLATGDNVQIIIPNGAVWGSSIMNYSFNKTRRVEVVVGIAYEDSIDHAMKVMQKIIDKEARILADPEPMIAVKELADNSVNIMARVWTKSGDFWPVSFDLNKAFKDAFDKEGISIPYPQRTLHVVNSTEGVIEDAAKKAG